MNIFLDGLREALNLLINGDSEVYKIIGLSFWVSGCATLAAAMIGIPLGIFLGLRTFPIKKVIGSILYTLMSVPPVVIGLVVTIMLSRKGIFGAYELLFTSQAMMIAQFLLVFPIVTGIMYGVAKEKGIVAFELSKTLGANHFESLCLIVRELKDSVLLAIMTGFGRAIAEVGAVMLVGGNIKGSTRVMTTFIAMSNSMGAFNQSIAMAIVLLSLSLIVNVMTHYLAGGITHVD